MMNPSHSKPVTWYSWWEISVSSPTTDPMKLLQKNSLSANVNTEGREEDVSLSSKNTNDSSLTVDRTYSCTRCFAWIVFSVFLHSYCLTMILRVGSGRISKVLSLSEILKMFQDLNCLRKMGLFIGWFLRLPKDF